MFEWFDMPSMLPETKVWGAVNEPFQYCMSYDKIEDRFHVSAKRYPNAGKMIDLGEYISRNDAIAACYTHWSNNR